MPRSARYSVNGERSSGTASTPLKGRFGRFRQVQRLFRCDKRHTGGFRYESCLRHEVTASGKLPGKREDVTALAQTEVVPEPFRHVHTERGRALTAVRRTIPKFVSAPSDRLMPQPREKVREGYLPHGVYIRPFHAACQLMTNLMPTPNWVWNFFVSPPHRQRSRRLASRAIRSAT